MEIRKYKVDECIAFNSKSGESCVLSNMYNYCGMIFDGKRFESNEKLFSWLCCDNEELKNDILQCRNGFAVKYLLNKHRNVNEEKGIDYKKKYFKYMWLGLRLKCKYCKEFRDFLLNSGDVPLVEYCYWLDKTKVNDEVWGTRLDKKKMEYIGYNACGRIMMGVREELKKGLI